VGTCLPVGLKTALVAAKTGVVLDLGGLSGVLAKSYESTNAFPATSCYVETARSMAILTSPALCLVARIVKEDFTHQSG
jgi:hypothetical protein